MTIGKSTLPPDRGVSSLERVSPPETETSDPWQAIRHANIYRKNHWQTLKDYTIPKFTTADSMRGDTLDQQQAMKLCINLVHSIVFHECDLPLDNLEHPVHTASAKGVSAPEQLRQVTKPSDAMPDYTERNAAWLKFAEQNIASFPESIVDDAVGKFYGWHMMRTVDQTDRDEQTDDKTIVDHFTESLLYTPQRHFLATKYFLHYYLPRKSADRITPQAYDMFFALEGLSDEENSALFVHLFGNVDRRIMITNWIELLEKLAEKNQISPKDAYRGLPSEMKEYIANFYTNQLTNYAEHIINPNSFYAHDSEIMRTVLNDSLGILAFANPPLSKQRLQEITLHALREHAALASSGSTITDNVREILHLYLNDGQINEAIAAGRRIKEHNIPGTEHYIALLNKGVSDDAARTVCSWIDAMQARRKMEGKPMAVFFDFARATHPNDVRRFRASIEDTEENVSPCITDHVETSDGTILVSYQEESEE